MSRQSEKSNDVSRARFVGGKEHFSVGVAKSGE